MRGMPTSDNQMSPQWCAELESMARRTTPASLRDVALGSRRRGHDPLDKIDKSLKEAEFWKRLK